MRGSLYDYSVAKFGKTFTDHLIEPAILKQFRTSPRELPWDSPFAVKRRVCGDMAQSKVWKQDRIMMSE